MTSKQLLRRLFGALAVFLLFGIGNNVLARSTSPIPEAVAPPILDTFSTQIGAVIYVTVTGKIVGSVWGSNPYTSDSNVASAAVHSGLVGVGETKVIRISILPGMASFEGSIANGVSSSNYGDFRSSIRIDPDDGGDNPTFPDPGQLRSFATVPGSVFRFQVTGNPSAGGVWGTNVYTSDSILASAAVHAGIISEGETKVVRVVIGAGQASYVASTAGGVSSSGFGPFSGSYSIANETGSNSVLAYPGMLENPMPAPANVSAYRGRNGGSYYFNVTGSSTGGVWGTGFYTDDSSLATAAVHARRLRVDQQGIVKVTIQPGRTSTAGGNIAYVGSTANGVTSNNFGSFSGSFSFSTPDGDLGAIPRITNPTPVIAQLLRNLNYTITSSPAATSYNATGLPSGLSVDATSGVISGTPEVSGTFPVQLLASNEAGTSNATLFLTVVSVDSTNAAPLSLSLTGPASIQGGGKAVLNATARYADNTFRTVTPIWASSNRSAAVVSVNGVLSAGSVQVDTPVTVTAFWRDSGVLVQSTFQTTVTAARAALTGLQIIGSNRVQSGGKLRLSAVAKYADGSLRPVVPDRILVSDTSLGSFNARGELTVSAVTEDSFLTVAALYTENGISKIGNLSISVVTTPSTLVELKLVGTRGILAAGGSLNLKAEGLYSDGSQKAVNANWQVSGTAASISSTGVISANTVSKDTPALVTARYSENGITKNSEFLILILAQSASTRIEAEVEAAGTIQNLGLSFWTNLGAQTTLNPGTRSSGQSIQPESLNRASGATYKLFVAAAVPSGPIVPTGAVLMLNRNSEWELAGFPLAEYLSGVTENSFQLVDIFDSLDASIISGTRIYVGYGITDTEMIESGRFTLVYQVQ